MSSLTASDDSTFETTLQLCLTIGGAGENRRELAEHLRECLKDPQKRAIVVLEIIKGYADELVQELDAEDIVDLSHMMRIAPSVLSRLSARVASEFYLSTFRAYPYRAAFKERGIDEPFRWSRSAEVDITRSHQAALSPLLCGARLSFSRSLRKVAAQVRPQLGAVLDAFMAVGRDINSRAKNAELRRAVEACNGVIGRQFLSSIADFITPAPEHFTNSAQEEEYWAARKNLSEDRAPVLVQALLSCSRSPECSTGMSENWLFGVVDPLRWESLVEGRLVSADAKARVQQSPLGRLLSASSERPTVFRGGTAKRGGSRRSFLPILAWLSDEVASGKVNVRTDFWLWDWLLIPAISGMTNTIDCGKSSKPSSNVKWT